MDFGERGDVFWTLMGLRIVVENPGCLCRGSGFHSEYEVLPEFQNRAKALMRMPVGPGGFFWEIYPVSFSLVGPKRELNARSAAAAMARTESPDFQQHVSAGSEEILFCDDEGSQSARVWASRRSRIL